MRRLDAYLLDRVHQPICNALYDRVGDCIVIARWMLAQVIGLTICVIILYLATHPLDWFAAYNLGPQALVALSMVFCRLSLRLHLGQSGLNPLRYIIYPIRLFLLLLVIPVTVGTVVIIILFVPFSVDMLRMGLEIIRDLVMISGFYFASCHNLPPPRRVKVKVPVHA